MTVSAERSELDGSGPSEEPDRLPDFQRVNCGVLTEEEGHMGT